MRELKKILIVDDDKLTRSYLENALSQDHTIVSAQNGQEALALANKRPDLILLDLTMPDVHGLDVLKKLRENPNTAAIKVIILTGTFTNEEELDSLRLGANDFIKKPANIEVLKLKIKILFENDNIHKTNQELMTLTMLSHISELRDNDTGSHINRISDYSKKVAVALGKSSDYSETISHASAMHDIGKVGIPDNILLKPGKLNAEEWTIMKQHTVLGSQILSNYDSETLDMAKKICLHHHEKWDGTGYPHGLMADDIPISAQIVSIVDVFDALSSKRPYKEPWPTQNILGYISDNVETFFSPKIEQAFTKALPDILISREYFRQMDNKAMGCVQIVGQDPILGANNSHYGGTGNGGRERCRSRVASVGLGGAKSKQRCETLQFKTTTIKEPKRDGKEQGR